MSNRKCNPKIAACIKMAEEVTWYVIPCPSNMQLTNVSKERGTHGSIYCLWECERKQPLWIGQSIPALVRSINEKGILNKSKRLHASSLYRVLRKEARKCSHKNFVVEKFSRANVEDVNSFISTFASVIFCTKAPELWKCSRPRSNATDEVLSLSSEAKMPLEAD